MSQKTAMQDRPTEGSAKSSRTMLLGVIAAIALWGVFHAVGTYTAVVKKKPQPVGTYTSGVKKPPQPVGTHTAGEVADWRKPVIVMACSLSFLSFWGLLLYLRGRRR